MQILGLAIPMYSEGIPFIHMGSEILHSKSMAAIVYYKRDDDNYSGWGVHLWNTTDYSGVASPTDWSSPLTYSGIEPTYETLHRIPLTSDATCVNFIVHNGDTKDLDGNNMSFKLSGLGYEVFVHSGIASVSATP